MAATPHVVAPRAVAARCLWTRLAGAVDESALPWLASVWSCIVVVKWAWKAPRTKGVGWDRNHGPCRPCWRGTFRYKRARDLEDRAVGKHNGLLILIKVQRVGLEAFFSQLLISWAKSVAVPFGEGSALDVHISAYRRTRRRLLVGGYNGED